MFKSIAKFSVRFRWPIIIFWIMMVPVTTSVFPNINSVAKNDVSDFLPKSSPTDSASKLENAFQHKDTATNTVIVVSRADGSITPEDNAAVAVLVKNVGKVDNVTEVRDFGVSADGRAHEYLVGIGGAAFGNGADQIIKDVRAAVAGAGLPEGLQVNVTGDLAAEVDQENANNRGRDNTEKYSIVLILVLLLIVFRSVLAPIITLLPAALALSIAQPVIAESTKAGVQVGFITQILLIVLLLGAGADYGLFLVFRVREELIKGLKPKEAVIEAMTHVGESITYSAATVIAALLCLMLATFGLYNGLGPALAIGLFVLLTISLTFLPAVLSVLGRAAFWPSKTSKRDLRIGLWGRLADRVIQKPVWVLLAGVVVFGGLMLGLIGYKSAGFGNSSAPAGSDSAIGQKVIDKHFPAANDNPQLIIFRFSQSVWDNPQQLAEAQAKLLASPLFKAVSGPLSANGFKLMPEQLQALHQSGGAEAQALNQFISADGKTVQFYAVLKAGDTGTTAAMGVVPAVRSEVESIAGQIGAQQAALYSQDSVGFDINQVATHDLKKIIPVVLIIIGTLLALLLRSLVAPWYLIATVGLSYLASLGFCMIVFVHILGQDGLNFVLPFLMFIFAMALGEDYNILVMSRIREEAHHTKSLSAAVTRAVGITGTTVTSAGLILAGTFTILGISGGNEQVEQIGFGIAFAIMLDTFFVRTLLVPSIVALLGKWNWWPSKLTNAHD